MIQLPELKMQSACVRMKSLTLGQMVSMANQELSTRSKSKLQTEFLKLVIDETTLGNANPQTWTAQERIYATIWYLGQTGSGVSSVKVGDYNASHFVMKDIGLFGSEWTKKSVALGNIFNDEEIWHVRHLRGYMQEAIDDVASSDVLDGVGKYAKYKILLALSQVVPESELSNNYEDNGFYQWLYDKACLAKSGMSDREIDTLINYLFIGWAKLAHFVPIGISESGIVATMAETEANGDGCSADFLAPILDNCRRWLT